MRLFSNWTWLFSNGAEDVVSQVDSALQANRQKLVKQTVPFADAGAATVEAGDTYTIPQVGATSTRARLLDLSADGNVYVSITQNSVAKVIELKGTTKCPARLTLTLAANVTAMTVESREGTADTELAWLYCEFTDITDRDNFPVV